MRVLEKRRKKKIKRLMTRYEMRKNRTGRDKEEGGREEAREGGKEKGVVAREQKKKERKERAFVPEL